MLRRCRFQILIRLLMAEPRSTKFSVKSAVTVSCLSHQHFAFHVYFSCLVPEKMSERRCSVQLESWVPRKCKINAIEALDYASFLAPIAFQQNAWEELKSKFNHDLFFSLEFVINKKCMNWVCRVIARNAWINQNREVQVLEGKLFNSVFLFYFLKFSFKAASLLLF